MLLEHTKCEQRGAAQVLRMLCESGTVVGLIYLATLGNPPVAPVDEHFLSNPCNDFNYRLIPNKNATIWRTGMYSKL
jgi:hypothetical protein